MDGLGEPPRGVKGEPGGRKRRPRFPGLASRASQAGITATRLDPGEWRATDGHTGVLRAHFESHNRYVLVAAALRTFCWLSLFQWRLLPQHLVEWRLADGGLIALCQVLRCGGALFGGVYACHPEFGRTANVWQNAVAAGLRLMAEARCTDLNVGPTYGLAKQLGGLSPLPLRVAVGALWAAAPSEGAAQAREQGCALQAPARADECV